MKKLCTIIMLGLSVWVYGQKSEKRNVIRKQHDDQMQLFSLSDKRALNNFQNSEKQSQFFLEDSLAASFLGIKEKKVNLKKTYNALRIEKQKDNIIRVVTGKDSQFKIAGQDDLKKCGGDATKYEYYKTTCEVYTIVKKDSVTSNAKFDVDFVWQRASNGDAKIIQVVTNPKEYTTKELAIAKAGIKGWYDKLDKNLKEEYRNKSISPLVVMTKDDIKLSWNSQNKKFTTEGPKIKITIPWEINAEDSIYYEAKPVAYYELTPSFTISMIPNWTEKTLTAVIDTVIYEEGSIVPPVKKVINEVQTLSDADREQREVALITFVQRFRIERMKFAGLPTEKGRRLLESMFTDKETGIVEVAKLIDFQERINSRIAKDYLSRLRGRLSVKLLKEQVQYDPTMDIVIFPFEQRYSSLDGKYEDETTKKLHLRYVNGNYFIERITVVPNTIHLITVKSE